MTRIMPAPDPGSHRDGHGGATPAAAPAASHARPPPLVTDRPPLVTDRPRTTRESGPTAPVCAAMLQLSREHAPILKKVILD